MVFRVRAPAIAAPWVNLVAGHIPDPVARLRFLQAVSPELPDRNGPPGRPWLVWSLISLALVTLAGSVVFLRHSAQAPRPRIVRAQPAPLPAAPPRGSLEVWLVERSGSAETYSNGLRIDTHFTVDTHTRFYLAFPVRTSEAATRRTIPAGIVFHTTESSQAPFEARQNGRLKRIGESLLDFVRRRRSYNFVIDRFGRVYRVVPEEQAANHAGQSIWADGNWAYLNLNESFLGVSFEATTVHPAISPGQIRSTTMLVEMLRSRFHIPAANCVTHSQVSVNPTNMHIGYHVDWASGFPFEAFGLPDNYAIPPPALWRFGFEADDTYRGLAGPHLLDAVERAGELFADRAAQANLDLPAFRRLLWKNYREMMAEVKAAGKGESADPE